MAYLHAPKATIVRYNAQQLSGALRLFNNTYTLFGASLTVTPSRTIHFSDLRAWWQRYRPFSYAITASIVLILICCLGLWLGFAESNRRNHVMDAYYGEHLSRIIATQLRQATANNDLISMQAQLNTLTEQTPLVSAVIYDNRNRAIVAAGEKRDDSEADTHKSFSMPIAQDENVIGQLTLVINSSGRNVYLPNLLAGVFGLAVLCLGVCCYCISQPQKAITKVANATIEPAALATTAITLFIQLNHVDKVFKPLTRAAREAQYANVLGFIDKALKIYNGQLYVANSHCLTVTIDQYELQQGLLNAVCCAGLIKQMANQLAWQINPRFIIHPKPSQHTALALICEFYHLQTLEQASIFIEASAGSLLDQAIEIQANKKGRHFVEVLGFSAKYQQLLADQCQRLSV